MSELYDTLGVGKKATKPQLKKAYRNLAKKHHPDMPEGDVEKFQDIQKAYMVLYDDTSRAAYDETGKINPAAINSELSNAYTTVATLFTNVLEQALGALETVDLVGTCRKQISENISAAISDIAKMKARISRLKVAKKRLHKNKKSKRKKRDASLKENILEGVILEQLVNCDKTITAMEKKISMCELMSVIIEDYDYSVDSPQPVTFSGSFAPSSTTTI